MKIKKTIFFTLFFLATWGIVLSQNYRTFQAEQEEILSRTKIEIEKEKILSGAKIDIGPFKLFPALYLKNVGYDDNVYYEKEEDQPISDFTSTLSPEVKVYLLFKNSLILSFSENPEYLFYFKEKNQRAFTNSFSPRVRYLFFHRFTISADYRHQMQRRHISSEIDRLITDQVNGYSLSLFYGTPRGTSIGLSGTIDKIQYEDILLPGSEAYLSTELNREERSGFLEFYYQVFSEIFFFYKIGYTEYAFEYFQTSWRNSYSYQTYAGIRFPLLGKIRGILSLGYKMFVPRGEGRKVFSGLAGNTSLDIRLGRFSFRLGYVRDSIFSYWEDVLYYIDNRLETGVSIYLARFLRIDYNYQYARSNYADFISNGLLERPYVGIKRRDASYTQSVGFVFRIIKNTGLGLAINTWQKRSNIPGLNLHRNFIGVYLTHEF